MMIPPYLDDGEPVFIKIASQSKAPKKGNSAKEGPFYRITDEEIQKHVDQGGNVGRVLRDQYVALDVDHELLLDELDSWPDTLVIESGGDDLGYHYYYRVPTWNENQKELTDSGRNIGSVRSGNSYCLVPPSIHDESGNRYTVSNPRKVAEIPVSRLSDLIKKYGSTFTSNTANTGGGSGGGGSSSGVGGANSPIPSEYPNQPAEWSTLKKWLKSNSMLSDMKLSTGDRSGREFKLAKCLAEGGFSETAISDALDRLPHDSKWHEEGRWYQKLTVQKAIESAVNDPYVEFSSTGDMDRDRSESRKTEESGEGRTLLGGEIDMVDFNEKESVLAKESNAEGSTAVKAVKVEGQDGSDNFEFVSLRKGNLRERETADGDKALIVDIDDTNGSSVGSPEDLEVVIEALEKLKEELE
jgi:hypothetical protein